MIEKYKLEKVITTKKDFLKDTDFPKSSYYYLNSKEEVASNKRKRGRKNNNRIFNKTHRKVLYQRRAFNSIHYSYIILWICKLRIENSKDIEK